MTRDPMDDVAYQFASGEGYLIGQQRDDLKALVRELRAALQEIAKGEGPYFRDPLTHAANCIAVMKRLANGALAKSAEPK